jgi:hypothetical protein
MTNRTESAARKLACERCGTEFTCSLSGACWCMEESYRLPMPAKGGGDCLCPGCLRNLAVEQSGAVAT